MRRQIERGLARRFGGRDPERRILANVIGPVSADFRRMLEAPSHEAAVLVPIIERAREPSLLLTERADHLTHHPGQVSFPGGRLEHAEEGHVDAALREAAEEVGLDRADVTIAGILPAHVTGTGFRVTPIVGFVAGSFMARPDPAEVRAAFEVPLAFALDRANVSERVHERYGTRLKSYELDYEGHRIWGATAAIIMSLLDLINDE